MGSGANGLFEKGHLLTAAKAGWTAREASDKTAARCGCGSTLSPMEMSTGQSERVVILRPPVSPDPVFAVFSQKTGAGKAGGGVRPRQCQLWLLAES